MKKIQTQGVHHITLVGATRQSAIDFWEGVLGMPFIFEQPNLDNPNESHLYFDPGDGRLITVFTNETREVKPIPNPEGIGNLHHIAFSVSRSTFIETAGRLKERGIPNTGEIDRGFMYSIYFRDPLGQRYELAAYKFNPPDGCTHAQVLF
jgi:glyoxalase family protein